jgi:beta-lactamase regulating signal transducer with metallopeptidase domain
MLDTLTGWLLSGSTPAWSTLHLLLDVVLQSTLLLLLSGVLVLMLKRASAALRHLVWSLTLGALLILPALNLSKPRRLMVLLPAIPASVMVSAPPSSDAFSNTSGEVPIVSPPIMTAGRATTYMSPQQWSREVWLGCGFGLWLCGLALVSSRTAAGLLGIRRLERQSVHLQGGKVIEQALIAQQALGYKRSIAVRLARPEAEVVVPLTWGIQRPVVLLPANVEEWSPEHLQAILRHEIAHVLRGDWLWLMMSQLVCALYWFHPLVWRAAAQMRAESERATDDRVLSSGIRASDYGECLLEFVRLLGATHRRPTMKLAIGMARPSTLENRLCAMLDARRNRRGVSRLHAVGAAALTAVFLLCMSTLGMVKSAADDTVKIKADFSSPEATVRTFIAAMEEHDNEDIQLSDCIMGMKASNVSPMPLDQLKKYVAASNVKVTHPFDALKTSIKGSNAVVDIISKGHFTFSTADGKLTGLGWKMGGKVNLRCVGDKWKIVPLSTNKSFPKIYSGIMIQATSLAIQSNEPDPVSPELRSDEEAMKCFDNISQLLSGMEWPGHGDRRLRLTHWRTEFLTLLQKNFRPGTIDPDTFFHCPADKTKGDSYSINTNLEGFDMDKHTETTQQTVFLYEGENGQLAFRHHGKAAVMLMNYKVLFVNREEAKSLRWKPFS